MALTKCVECGTEISTEAVSCLHGGRPIKEDIQTIQLTSKRWKIIKLIAWIGLIIGFFMFTSNMEHGGWQNMYSGMGFCLGFFSFILLLVGKFGNWWSNK